MHIRFRSILVAAISFAVTSIAFASDSGSFGAFILTSDVHYGIARGNFRGAVNVDAQVVNAAMVERMNHLPNTLLPKDEGLNAGLAVGPIDFIAITGDITNRQELYPLPIQSSSVSWAQFDKGFIHGLTLQDSTGQPTPLLLVPGNHDVSNAIGFTAQMNPSKDATSLAEIFNRMVRPEKLRTKETYDYATDKIYYSRNIAGVHCIFLTIWPETTARTWIESDLKTVPPEMPVFLFAHDMPEVDPKHLTNPNGDHSINSKDRFENLLADECADGATTDVTTVIEQRAFVSFLKKHRNIVAYFHGHSNWTEFYTWKGPDNDIALNTFRSDSPMKGKFSGKDETKLAFQLISFDAVAQKMTVRECLWNADLKSTDPTGPVSWGKSLTVSIAPRQN
jgi:hypothetical protein